MKSFSVIRAWILERAASEPEMPATSDENTCLTRLTTVVVSNVELSTLAYVVAVQHLMYERSINADTQAQKRGSTHMNIAW